MNIEEFRQYLKSIFRFERQSVRGLVHNEEQTKESLDRVRARIWERLKSGHLPKDLDVDCQIVRPMLALAADPLELTVPPSWLEEHIALCRDCRRELEGLEELSHVIVVAEMPVLAREVIADASPEFMEKVHKLRAIQPEKVACKQARPYYRDMATCNLEAPAEIYRHVKNCASCKEQVEQLRQSLPGGPNWKHVIQ